MKKINVPLWAWLPEVVLVVLGLVYFSFFSPFKAREASMEILDYAENDAMMIIDDGDTLTFCPLFATETKGLIFYTGARVDYHAYTPIMYQIAQAGVPVVVVKMPLNLALFAPNKADQIIDSAYFPCENEITEWYIGGHSMGGFVAAQYASENLDTVKGLILWGSYPAESVDLSHSQLDVVSIFGSNDMVSDLEEIQNSRQQFPANARFYGISGANHAQFGDYGEQRGDGEALIAPSEQWRLVTDLTLQSMYSTAQN